MKIVKVRHTIGYHITSDAFSKSLTKAVESGEDVEIHINSPGGSVSHGWEMFNEMRMFVTRGAKISTYNMGLAASMGSMLMLGAQKENRYMAENSLYMIHMPKGLMIGDEDDMKKEAELLSKIGDLGSELYAKETNTSSDYMRAAMKATSWYTAKEAKAEGFIGSIVDGVEQKEPLQAFGMGDDVIALMKEKVAHLNHLDLLNEKPKIQTADDTADITKISNSQIRETAWKKFMKH